jgi:hypothetical protein
MRIFSVILLLPAHGGRPSLPQSGTRETQYLSCREGQQGDIASPLDSGCQAALVRCAHAGETPRHDLAALGHELLQQPHVFVIDIVNFLDTELADLFAAKELAPGIASAGSGAAIATVSAIATITAVSTS